MKTIFPKEFLEYTLEFHRYHSMKKSKSIYFILLCAIFLMGLSLPFIKIGLYASSPGMIRPSKERNLITSPISGKISTVYITENDLVKKGDTLIRLDDTSVSYKINLISEQIEYLHQYIHDLEKLSVNKTISTEALQSAYYKSQLQQYLEQLIDKERKMRRATTVYNRQKHLFEKGVIAKMEYNNSTFELENARNELQYVRKNQQSIWQHQLDQRKSALREARSKLQTLEKDRSRHYIVAPEKGNIQALKGLEKGNFLYTGSSIAEISPQTDLMVECYVSPTDIGWLQQDHEVKFHVDAFKHSHWGSASGKVVRINSDVTNINNNPVFKVYCSMNETGLFLNERVKGNFQKGMTLTALFFIENRSLSQLLFDQIEDWYDAS